MKFLKLSFLTLILACSSNLVTAQDDDVIAAASKAPFGAKVVGHTEVPTGGSDAYFSRVIWDIGGYVAPFEPLTIQVPYVEDLSGRYVIHAAVRWINPGPVIQRSYFYAPVRINGAVAGNDARATANMVHGGATGTTQYYSFEVDLRAGDIVTLDLYQDFGVTIGADAHLTVTFRPRN